MSSANQSRNAEIVARRKAGQWPSQIAAEMGVSRNAVIGVCGRAGLCDGSIDRTACALRGERRPLAKLSECAVRDIRARYRPYSKTHGLKALAEQFGVSMNTVFCVVSGRTWSHVQ